MARCCNSLFQKIWNILKSPIQGKRSSSEAQTTSHPKQRLSEDALLAVKQTGETAEPNLWAGHLEVQSMVTINFWNTFLILSPSWDTKEQGGLAVPCRAEIGQYHLLKYYKSTVPAGHSTVCLGPSTDQNKALWLQKDDMLGSFIMSHLTFLAFLIDCSCHQGLTKCITLLAFAAPQQVQILVPQASFGGPALWFRKYLQRLKSLILFSSKNIKF